MPEPVLRFAAAFLGATFAWAALAKIVKWRQWREALRAYRLPPALAAPAAPVVPIVEAGGAVLLLAGWTHAGAALTVALLASFSAALLYAQSQRGGKLPCGCFGRATERDYRVMLVRNTLLGVLATTLLVADRDIWFAGELSVPDGSDIVPALLVVAGLALAAWIVWQAVSMFGRRGPS